MRIFSGVQPTGSLHLGNYLGALKQFVELQNDDRNECIFCIVDLHAITLPKDPKELKDSVLDVAAAYIAIGLDPKKSILFVQSEVPEVTFLSWVLTCNSYTGELSRMTQFKDKARGNESAPAGLFTYPILMAADILLYDADIVPVGADQKQHIELTRNLAERMNHKYGDDMFVVPDGKFMKGGAKIMSLSDPLSKMSKSSENEMSAVGLFDDEKKIEKVLKRAETDSIGKVHFDEINQPGISNLMTIYAKLSDDLSDLEIDIAMKKIEDLYEGRGYGDFKKDLVEITINALRPIKARFNEIRNSDELQTALNDGRDRASEIACEVIKRVKEKVGLSRD